MRRLERATLGVCGGFLLAVSGVFVAVAGGIELTQTGPSPGKTLFFSLGLYSGVLLCLAYTEECQAVLTYLFYL